MPSTGFIIALAFAAVFGGMLIWLLLYYAHRYIHHQCLQLDHWFHLISPRETAARCCDQEKYMGCETCLRDRTRSARQERGRERSTKRYRSRDHEGHRAREADPEWIAQPKLQRPRRMLQMGAPAQNQWFGQPDYQQTPWQEQIPVPTQMSYPQAVAYSQMPQQGALPIFTPAYGPHMTNPTKAATMPEPVNYQHQHRHQQAQSEDRSDATRSKHTVIQTDKLPPQRKRNRGPAKVDYIHICDELPSIVLKSLKKSTIATSTTSSSSDSSGDSSTTQEVPRVSIPRAAPKATDTLPFQYPEYAYNPARPHIPATDPKPWIDDTAKGGRSKFKSRYAPFEPMSCQKEQSRRVRADGKQPAPNLDASPPHRSGSQTQQRKGNRKERQFHRSQERRQASVSDKPTSKEPFSNELKQEKEVPGDVKNLPVASEHTKTEQLEKEQKQQPTCISPKVPFYEPMPVPVIEEPSTPKPEKVNPAKWPAKPAAQLDPAV